MAHTCPGCNLPMVDGQVFNGLLKCHWDCQDMVREKMGERNANDLIQYRIDARLRMEGLDPDHHLWKKLGGS
ncbi:hypothetical protein phiPsa397_151 [Pseudomonas phage phiPsa397]|uniref:Uncharacterized protein n=1 Tax=Pseudomonas phage phiPsa397 TaxID=1460367 RepID=A0A7G9V3J8_9CAUD|nr:hypothetical protein QGX16_gp074 [Pseudomonas phage phiPsa397]QNO00854.1 hypothetical protein phiPsa397_151 [Pseudomonas phage phiPsa397]